MSERQIQYEFKVIVRAGANEWPHEVADHIKSGITLNEMWRRGGLEVVSVEQIRDYS